jgi:N-acetylneuraminic acid mutarotase
MQKMKYKRRGAVAVLIGKSVYVMGGADENGKDLKSVQCFDIERNSWHELPSMNEERYQATAVAC